MRKQRFALAAAGAVLAAAVAVTGCAKKKDPKEVVIEAFENVYTDDQVKPMEEIFGLSELGETMLNTDNEAGLTLKLDSCSEAEINAWAGSGLRIGTKSDLTNDRSSAEIAVIYNGMDLAAMNMYYGEETLLLTIPELSSKVFALDVSEGLLDRVKASPLIGPLLVQSGVDLDELSDYLDDLTAQADQEGGAIKPFDAKALWKRYKEGSQAQENFKAALTVEKSDGKATFTVDGKEAECEIYQVFVSKASMIEFLRTSSDFFLQDEELKQEYVRQLELTVKMSEILGGTMSGVPGAEEMLTGNYDQLKEGVDTIIEYLEESLSDINMTVYVTKAGRLAAVDGTTSVTTDSVIKTVGVAFHAELQGGAYPTQNAAASITLSDADKQEDLGILSFSKGGVYDKEQWTADFSAGIESVAAAETYTFNYNSTYNLKDRDFLIEADITSGGSRLAGITAEGIVDSLEKGKSIHVTLDSLAASAMDDYAGIVFSGAFYYQPLDGEVTAPEGTRFDVLTATENDWMSVLMEAMSGLSTMAEQLGLEF